VESEWLSVARGGSAVETKQSHKESNYRSASDNKQTVLVIFFTTIGATTDGEPFTRTVLF